jgi:hypothetical protein
VPESFIVTKMPDKTTFKKRTYFSLLFQRFQSKVLVSVDFWPVVRQNIMAAGAGGGRGSQQT